LLANFATCLGYLSQTPFAGDLEDLFSALRSSLCSPPLSLATPSLTLEAFSLDHLTTTQLTPSVRLSNLPLQLTAAATATPTCVTVAILPQLSSAHGYTYQEQIRVDFMPKEGSAQVEYKFNGLADGSGRCVSRDSENGEGTLGWSEEVCETEISDTKVVCRCNQIKSKWVTIRAEERALGS
jgi:hypothetical protein